jgi:hypothetical protein
MSVPPTGRKGAEKGSSWQLQFHQARKDDSVHGPELTPQEAVASVARRVRRGEAVGVDHEEAIRLTSAETGIDPEKVRWCVETAFPGSTVRPSPSRTRRRVALAMAAAF